MSSVRVVRVELRREVCAARAATWVVVWELRVAREAVDAD